MVFVSLLKEMVKVKLDNEQGADIEEYHIDNEDCTGCEKKNDNEENLLEELKELED